MAARSGASPDGRVQRAERSREAIVGALFEIVGEGTPVPTAQQVADRAGVAIRTVFRHFSDMESLFAEISERLRAEIRPLVRGKPVAGSFRTRLLALVLRRARLFERILPYRRSVQIQRTNSPFLEAELRSNQKALRSELRRWLPELESDEILEAMDATLSPDLWIRLRIEQRLGVRRAEATLEQMALAIAGGRAR